MTKIYNTMYLKSKKKFQNGCISGFLIYTFQFKISCLVVKYFENGFENECYFKENKAILLRSYLHLLE